MNHSGLFFGVAIVALASLLARGPKPTTCNDGCGYVGDSSETSSTNNSYLLYQYKEWEAKSRPLMIEKEKQPLLLI